MLVAVKKLVIVGPQQLFLEIPCWGRCRHSRFFRSALCSSRYEFSGQVSGLSWPRLVVGNAREIAATKDADWVVRAAQTFCISASSPMTETGE